MTNQFKVGDVCIGQNHFMHTQFNGMQCEVIGGLEFRHGRLYGTLVPVNEFQYEVLWANGETTNALPYQLRLKRPPAQSGEDSIMSLLKQPIADGVLA